MTETVYNIDQAAVATVSIPTGTMLRSSWAGYVCRGETRLLSNDDDAVSIPIQRSVPAVFHVFVGAYLNRIVGLHDGEPFEIFRVYRDLNTEPYDDPYGGEILDDQDLNGVRMVVSFDHLAGDHLVDRAVLARELLKPPFETIPRSLATEPAPVYLAPRPEVYHASCAWLGHPGISRSGSLGEDEEITRRVRLRERKLWIN